MKRRLTPIIVITAGLILISGFAYALDKKKQEKSERLPDSVHEEEALRAELLAATEEEQKKPRGVAESKTRKVAVIRGGAGMGEQKASK